MIQDLTTQVYKKLDKEYENFIDEILKTEPKNIVDNAYKIAIMQEFVDMFYGTENYSKYELMALLEKENSLEFLYDDWINADNGIHNVLEDNMNECLLELSESYIEKLEEQAKSDSNYELLKDMSEALKDFDNYNFCDYIKNKYNLDSFEVIDVHEIMNKVGGAEYLYHYFAQLVDDNHLQYLNEISVIDSDNYKNIEEKILPKLKEIMNNEKNKNNVIKDKERNER